MPHTDVPEPPARVLFVTTTASTLRAFLLPIAALVRDAGHRVDAVAGLMVQCPQCPDHFDALHEVPWRRRNWNPLRLLSGGRTVRRVVRAGHHDLVHVHTPIAAFVTRAALATLRRRPVVVYTSHGLPFHEQRSRLGNAVYELLERLAGRWTDYLVVLTDEDRRAAVARRIVPEERIVVVDGAGFDPERFDPATVAPDAGARVRAELGIPATARIVLTVAVFWPHKRHEDVVRALPLLDPSTHVVFAGTGPTQDRIAALAAELGVADRVHVLGWRADIPHLLAACDVFAFPSLWEGLPRSVTEAMSMGKPIVGSDIRGNRDLLGGGAGVLVPPRDPAALAAAARRILDDPDLAARLGSAARARSVRYRLAAVVAGHDALYRRALQARRQGGGEPR